MDLQYASKKWIQNHAISFHKTLLTVPFVSHFQWQYSLVFSSVSFCSFRSVFTMELERTNHLVSRGYAHFWRRLRKVSVRHHEAFRAYKHGCEAVGSPAKQLFSDEQERRWTLRNSLRNRTVLKQNEAVCEPLGCRLVTLHSGFFHIFAKRNGIDLGTFFLTQTVVQITEQRHTNCLIDKIVR